MAVSKPVITCDGCSKEIVGRPGYPRNDYLVLGIATAPTEHQDMTYAIMQYPMLDRQYQFHNRTCLKLWVDEHEKLKPPRKDRLVWSE